MIIYLCIATNKRTQEKTRLGNLQQQRIINVNTLPYLLIVSKRNTGLKNSLLTEKNDQSFI